MVGTFGKWDGFSWKGVSVMGSRALFLVLGSAGLITMG